MMKKKKKQEELSADITGQKAEPAENTGKNTEDEGSDISDTGIVIEINGKEVNRETKDEMQLMEEKCRTLETEKDEAVNKNLRLLAEFDNYRRRNDKERINWIKNANEKLLLKICDVLDDFERALEVKPEEGHFEHYQKGVESIFKKLEKTVTSEGLEKIDALGKEFDPMYHEAISYIPANEQADTIVSVVQNGYIMNHKVIRAAKVVVSAGINNGVESDD